MEVVSKLLKKIVITGNYLLLSMMLLFGFPNTSYGQNKGPQPEQRFERIDEEIGLTIGTINGIAQDTLGFIWIATEDGLHRYDGQNIKVFRRNNQEEGSLPNNYIQQVYVDSQNKVWALTDYGIGIYDYSIGEFEVILPGVDSTSIQYRSVTSISEMGDQFAIGTFGSGVSIYSNGKFSKLPNDPNADYNIENSSISAVQFLNQDVLVVGTWYNGLYFYDLSSKSLDKISIGTDTYRVFGLFKDYDDRIWAATSLGMILISDQGVKLYGPNFSEILPKDDYLSIYANREFLWVGTRSNGLLRLPMTDFDHYAREFNVTKFSSNQGLDGTSSRTVSSVFEDRDGNIWIGTHNGGINVLNPKGETVSLIKRDEQRRLSLSISKVWGLAEDTKGNIWIGTDGEGIDIYDLESGAIEPFHLNNQLNDKAILCLSEIDKGAMLIGTYSGGILKYDYLNDQVEEIRGSEVNDIRCIEVLKDNSALIGTNGGGAYKYDKGLLTSIPGTSPLDVRDIKDGDNDIVWIGTYGSGLVKVNLKTEELTYYNWYKDSEQFTPITQTMYKSENHIWIGTKYSGLVLFDTHSETFQVFNEEDGLINNTVRSIVSDERGTLWLSTNNGIAAFNIKNKKFYNYDKFDGFQDGQFNDNSGLLLSSGKIVFGGVNGLNLFESEKLKEPEQLPEIVLTGLTILSGDEGSLEMNNLPLEEHITLSHDQNFFRIDFAPIHYPFSKKWIVQSKLDGLDLDWTISGGNNNSLLFRGLGFGDYTLKLRVVEGEFIGPEKELQITIVPPFWLRWYAFVLYTLLLVLIVAVIIRYNSRQISLREKLGYEKKLRLKENEVLQRKLRFFTNISHEIRTPLTLISGPIKDLQRKHTDDLESKDLLSIINRNGELLKKLVDRLLEFRKVETEEAILTLDYYEISELLQEELESFQYQAASKEVQIKYHGENKISGWVDIEKLQIILNNLLSNAVKYVEQRGEIIISAVVEKKKELIISVIDDGKGIEESDIKNVFEPFYQGKNSVGKGGTGIGLSLSKRLVEIHRGELSVLSTPDEGTTFSFKIPIDKESYIDFPGSRFRNTNAEKELSDDITLDTNDKFSKEIDDKILVIADDNEDILQYLKTTFHKEYTIKTAVDGDQAWSLVINSIPDLVISDIMMPGTTGLDLCSKIKSVEATSHIPVILLTAKEGAEEKIDGFKAGADQYVTKPFDAQELKSRVKNLIESREKLKLKLTNSDLPFENEDDENVIFLKKVEDAIFENIDNSNFSVNDLAKELGFSRTSLYRKLKALTGESINHFIRTIKLKKAAEMLRVNNATVSSVAFYLGFTDLKYFRTCFKEVHGVLPSEFQRKFTRMASSK